jgi:nucleotide-binding universal stress UspA family protein
MFLKRVVLGIDFSDASLGTARWAARHLAPDAELALVHVVPLAPPPGFLRRELPGSDHLLEHARDATRQGLRGLANSIGAVRCITSVRAGEPAEELVHAAAEVEAELIVIGRAGQRARTGRGMGTTADRLTRRSPLPVLLAARTLRATPHHILAPIDESEVGLEVLRWARRLGVQCDASITALHVVHDTIRAYLDAAGAGAVDDAARTSDDARHGAHGVRDAAHTWLQSRMRTAGIDPAHESSAATIGDPRHELLVAAECFDADLIVVGQHGADADERSGLGSVARAALRPSTRSVLVVPPPSGGSVLRGPGPGRQLLTVVRSSRSPRRRLEVEVGAGPPAA